MFNGFSCIAPALQMRSASEAAKGDWKARLPIVTQSFNGLVMARCRLCPRLTQLGHPQ